jgi:hypothetical protein
MFTAFFTALAAWLALTAIIAVELWLAPVRDDLE